MMPVLEESVEVKIMVKVNGEYEFASGKNMDDLIEFILYHMDNWKYFNGATKEEDNEQEEVKDPPKKSSDDLDTMKILRRETFKLTLTGMRYKICWKFHSQ